MPRRHAACYSEVVSSIADKIHPGCPKSRLRGRSVVGARVAGLGAILCFAGITLQERACAQGAGDALPLPVRVQVESYAEAGFRVDRKSERVVGAVHRIRQLENGGEELVEIPLGREVEDLEVAWTKSRTLAVLLSGGVREDEPLDVLLVSPDGELLQRVPTGGLRLPDSFGDGLGSWPMILGEGEVVLFAHRGTSRGSRRSGRIDVVALDVTGRKLAARSVPMRVNGFRPSVLRHRSAIEVDFTVAPGSLPTAGRIPEPMRFPHPRAPKFDWSPAVLDFAEATPDGLCYLKLENVGESTLEVLLTETAHAARPVDGVKRWTLQPGADPLRVPFEQIDPQLSDATQGTVQFATNTWRDRTVIPVRWPEPKPPEPDPPEPEPQDSSSASANTTEPGDGGSSARESGEGVSPEVGSGSEPDDPLEQPLAISPPQVGDVSVRHEPDAVWVSGVVRAAFVHLEIRREGSEASPDAPLHASRIQLGPDGGFSWMVPGPEGVLFAASEDRAGSRSDWARLGHLGPWWDRDAEGNPVLVTPPGLGYVVEVLLPASLSAVPVVLARIRGEADSTGRTVVGATALPARYRSFPRRARVNYGTTWRTTPLDSLR